MKKIIFILILSLSFCVSYADWQRTNGPNGNVSAGTLFNIGDSLYIRQGNNFLISTDNGESWNKLKIVELPKREDFVFGLGISCFAYDRKYDNIYAYMSGSVYVSG